MNTEKGIIKEINRDYVLLESVPLSSCASCASKGLCSAGKTKKYRAVKAINVNNLDLNVGEEVEFYIEEKNIVMVSLFIYFFPVLMLLIGAITGVNYLPIDMDRELLGVITGGLFFILSFLIIKLLSPLLENKKLMFGEIIKKVDV